MIEWLTATYEAPRWVGVLVMVVVAWHVVVDICREIERRKGARK